MIKFLFLVLFSINLFGFEYIATSKDSSIEDMIHFKNYLKSEGDFVYLNHNKDITWLKEQYKNSKEIFKQYYIVFKPIFITEVEIYIVENGQIKVLKEANTSNSLFYIINIPPSSNIAIYMKIPFNNGNFMFTTYDNLWSFLKNLFNELFAEVVVSSILFVAFVISMILFLMLRDLSFLFYSLYTISIATLLMLNNQLYLYFLGNQPSEFVITINMIVILTSALWFALSFVDFFENRVKLRNYFIGFSIISSIIVITNYLYGLYITTILHFSVILTTLILILTVLLKSIKKKPLAKLLLIGWGFVFIGTLYNILWLLGIIDENSYYIYYFVAGSIVLEVFIFAIALGVGLKNKNSERIKALKKSHKQEVIIEQQARFATIGKILAGIEHQWRAPLNYLSSIILELQATIFSDEKLQTENLTMCVNSLEDIVKEMDETMKDFRYFYLSNKSKQSFYISKIFDETFTYFSRYFANKSIEFKINDLEQLVINSYPNYFRHILLNFLENSTKLAKSRNIEYLKININIFKEGDFIICNIIDNVGGAKNIDKIFEPFYSEKSENSSGIGLYLVKELVENELKGDIIAQNYKDGLKITLKVPFEV